MNNTSGRVLPQYLHGACKDSFHTLAPALIPRVAAQGKLPQLWVHVPAHLCCPKVTSELGPLGPLSRMVYKTPVRLFLTLSPRETSPSCKQSALSLLPASLTPSCSWPSLLSMPVTNYHSVTSRIFPYKVNVEILS